MIDKDNLISIARLNGLKSWQQEKHYIQSLILNSLSDLPLVFKGGTYLWFFHGLRRFSEDLDFTAIRDISDNLGFRVSKDLELFGVENTLKEIRNNEISFSFRISAKGPLNTSDIDLCHVYVEISRRERVINDPLSVKLDQHAYGIPIKILQGMGLSEVVYEKVRALMTRNKARDLYDMWYLLENFEINFNLDLINKKLKYYDFKFSKENFLELAKGHKKYFSKELKQLVFGNLPSFNDCISLVERWVK